MSGGVQSGGQKPGYLAAAPPAPVTATASGPKRPTCFVFCALYDLQADATLLLSQALTHHLEN
eukprot:scaffold21603_cov19-Tisochrysis_lutea.AAC.2